MQAIPSQRGDPPARQHFDHFDLGNTPPRGPDRRQDSASLFGGYQGPERRSGRERRAQA